MGAPWMDGQSREEAGPQLEPRDTEIEAHTHNARAVWGVSTLFHTRVSSCWR